MDSRMLAAAALAAVMAVTVLMATAPSSTVDVLVAATPAAAGSRVDSLELERRAVLDSTGLVPAADLAEVAAHTLLIDLEPGSPLVATAIEDPQGGHGIDVVGLELPSDAAVHGALVAGDEVDVYSTSDPATLIARRVVVVAVLGDGGSLGTGDIGVLLAVDDELAPTLIAAAADDALHLVRRGS